jgi:hypothetical protein
MDRFRLIPLMVVPVSALGATSETLDDWRAQYCIEHVVADPFSETQTEMSLGVTNRAFMLFPRDVGVVVRKFVFPDQEVFEAIAKVEVLDVVDPGGSIRLRRLDQRKWTIRPGDMVFIVPRRPWPRFTNWRITTEGVRHAPGKSDAPELVTNVCRSGRYAAFIEYGAMGGGIGSFTLASKRAEEMRKIAEGRTSKTAIAISIRDVDGRVERMHALPERVEIDAGPFWGASEQSIFCVFSTFSGAGRQDAALWGKRIDGDTSPWVKVLEGGWLSGLTLGPTRIALRQDAGLDGAGGWIVGDVTWENECPPVQSVDLGRVGHE